MGVLAWWASTGVARGAGFSHPAEATKLPAGDSSLSQSRVHPTDIMPRGLKCQREQRRLGEPGHRRCLKKPRRARSINDEVDARDVAESEGDVRRNRGLGSLGRYFVTDPGRRVVAGLPRRVAGLEAINTRD